MSKLLRSLYSTLFSVRGEAALEDVPRRLVELPLVAIATIVWAHSLAGPARAWLRIEPAALQSASATLTWMALAVAVGAWLFGSGTHRWSIAGLTLSLGAVGISHGLRWEAAAVFWCLVPASVGAAVMGSRLVMARNRSFFRGLAGRKWQWAVWALFALGAVVQMGRLSTHISNPDSGWFLSTSHPFYAKHECLPAYVYGAELSARGESNVYLAAHYPVLDQAAKPESEVVGMTAEDPFQYPPQFLLLPRLGLALSHDYGAIRSAWFGLNVSLCVFAMWLLARWVGGRAGQVANLAVPIALVAFPVLHNFQYGQFHFAAVALAIASMMAFQLRRNAVGGGLLGVAIVAKVFPAILLLPLLVQRRWRALGWTGGALGALTLGAWLVLGATPFAAFWSYQLPRLASGQAFAFGEAWPEVAELVIADNQGVRGVLDKLVGLGWLGADSFAYTLVPLIYGLSLALSAAWLGAQARFGRFQLACAWLGLLGLASLASAGAWADYVPLTGVWLMLYLVSRSRVSRWTIGAAVLAVPAHFALVGAVPWGSAADASWMYPVSLVGALVGFLTLCLGVFSGSRINQVFGVRPREARRPVTNSRSGLA